MGSSSAPDSGDVSLRQAGAADLDAFVAVWNAITPEEPVTVESQRSRLGRERRLSLIAELDGEVVGCGLGAPSDSPERGVVQPRVLPAARRRGIGRALLRMLIDHVEASGFEVASAFVDGNDEGSLVFAERFGFAGAERQVEQVWSASEVDAVPPPPGITFVTIAERPDLLRRAYPLGLQGWADMATATPVTISLQTWLDEEATLPEGSFVALAGDEIVGYSGLLRHGEDGVAEDGLTVVRRAWRRRGLATALKRAELAWASANGVREVVTWTQRGNEAMRATNERLGYTYRSVSITVHRRL